MSWCEWAVNVDCQLVLSLLREFDRQLDWNIAVERPSSATGSGSGNSCDQSQTSSSTVNYDVIQQRRHYTALTDEPRGRRRRRPSSVTASSLSTLQPRIIHR